MFQQLLALIFAWLEVPLSHASVAQQDEDRPRRAAPVPLVDTQHEEEPEPRC